MQDRVVVSRRDRSLCIEDFRRILVEVRSIAVKRDVPHEGQERVISDPCGSP